MQPNNPTPQSKNNSAPLRPAYDAVVVGARVAGAATAMLLARGGLSVLLVERDHPGADTLSTLALMRAGVLQLHRWGLLDAVRDSGAPAIRTTTFAYGDDSLTLDIKPRDGIDALYAPRRNVLDRLLAEAAASAGADVRFGPRLVDVTVDAGGGITGAVLEDREGVRHTVRAGIVIGADGLRSTLARLVEAPVYREGKHAGGTVYAFWPGLGNHGNRWLYREGVGAGAIPTHAGETCLFAATHDRRFRDAAAGDLEGWFREVVAETSPELAAELGDETPASVRFRGFPGHVGQMRASHGPGWALVGDAGYFKDPITAHGISDALRDAELLARAVLRGTADALADYQKVRDELSIELFDITDEIASYDWNLDRLQELHLQLSRTMNREVDALLELDAPAPTEPSRRPTVA